MRLEGKVALVTGAGRGIGRVIAEHLAEEGAAVVLNYPRPEEHARDAAEGIVSRGGRAVAEQADITDLRQIERLVDAAATRFGRLDILVNNAGIDPGAPLLDVQFEMWDRVMNTNARGAYFCTQAAARVMTRQGQGRIVNISSVHAHATMPGFSVYAASKGAIEAMTRQLALDLAPHRITINCVAPGAIEVEKFVADPAYDREAVGREIPLGRVGLPRDISSAVVFLASDDAAWLTGQAIVVDGGTTARLYLYAGRPIPSGHRSSAEAK